MVLANVRATCKMLEVIYNELASHQGWKSNTPGQVMKQQNPELSTGADEPSGSPGTGANSPAQQSVNKSPECFHSLPQRLEEGLTVLCETNPLP